MIYRRGLFITWLVAALCGAAAPHVRAAESPKQQAARLLDTGVQQFEEGHAALALESFQAAYKLYPSAKILLNMGQALKGLGRLAEAAQAYDRFLVETSALPEVGDRRVALARAGLAEILPRIGRLRLSVQPAEATISVDSQVIGRASQLRTLYLPAGEHQVSAAATGFVDRSMAVSAAAGGEQHLELVLEPVPSAGPAVATEPAPAPAPPGRRWTWVAAGASGALLAGGIGLGLHTNALWREYRQTQSPERYDELHSQIGREATITNILFIGAGAAAITAGVLYYFEGPRRREVRVGLVPSSDGLYGTARWVF